MKTFVRIAVAALMLAASLAATTLPQDISDQITGRRGPLPACDPYSQSCG